MLGRGSRVAPAVLTSVAAAPRSGLIEQVEQWGLLSWTKRWITFDGSTVKLHKHHPGSEGPMPYNFDLKDTATKVIPDQKNDRRITLDNGSALIHVKFSSADVRAKFLAATSGAAAPKAAGGKPTFVLDKKRYPIEMGKYWLGPIDPTNPDPAGGFGFVMAGINSETGERVCCKMSNSEYEGTEAQRLEVRVRAHYFQRRRYAQRGAARRGRRRASTARALGSRVRAASGAHVRTGDHAGGPAPREHRGLAGHRVRGSARRARQRKDPHDHGAHDRRRAVLRS